MTAITFTYDVPHQIKLTVPLLRKTLREVRDQLLSRDINGGSKKLSMETVCVRTRARGCGMAACIGGWTSIFLLGFEGKANTDLVEKLFENLIALDHRPVGNGQLYALFYDFSHTSDFNEPNVAATAIHRYLSGKYPWPRGDMPRILPYTKRAPAKTRYDGRSRKSGVASASSR